MLTMNKLTKILDLVEYRDWNWRVFELKDKAGFLIQFHWEDVDIDTNAVTEQSSRKWYISRHATESEVVQTALKAALTAEEHEVRERFKYRGKRIFGPHIAVGARLDIADHHEVRT